MLLDEIRDLGDIKKIDPKQYSRLASDIRRFLVKKVSVSGGHLASNLGAVELTMALHLVLDLPKDKLLFDVGHQCYTHKILSGRKEGFDRLRSFGGLSGFPNAEESECDIFTTGHSSTSLSMGLGLARARDLKGERFTVVSVIGDGSMTGGLAYEALNNAAELKGNFIIVLNDNGKSIGDNVGGIPGAFEQLRTAPRYNRLKQDVKNTLDRIPAVGGRMVQRIGRAKDAVKQMLLPNMYFETMGLTYLGPVDGHNIPAMIKTFRAAKRLNRAVIVHVVTKKGKGYAPAEQDPERFHGIGPFDVKSGRSLDTGSKTFTDYVSEGLLSLAEKDPRVVAITAAMASGTGLSDFMRKYPDRFFDVGIAEEHAVSFAAGLAKGGFKPYVCIYSTFLQRSYDQIVHDVALQKANVTLLIDRAGLVGQDGATHQGMLDGAYLQTVPGITMMAAADGEELSDMLDFSLSFDGPLAIRYPRGSAQSAPALTHETIAYGKAEILRRGQDILIFAAGSMVVTAAAVAEELVQKGLDPTLINARFLKPFDEDLLKEMKPNHSLLCVLEENNRSGALGQQIADWNSREDLGYYLFNGAPEDGFYPHGDTESIKAMLQIDTPSLSRRILERWEKISHEKTT